MVVARCLLFFGCLEIRSNNGILSQEGTIDFRKEPNNAAVVLDVSVCVYPEPTGGMLFCKQHVIHLENNMTASCQKGMFFADYTPTVRVYLNADAIPIFSMSSERVVTNVGTTTTTKLVPGFLE